MNYLTKLESLLNKINVALKDINPNKLEKLAQMILGAKRIFVIGGGRSGLMGSAFVMRLVQTGIHAYKVDSVEAPSISHEDVLIAISGSGNTELTKYYVNIAKNLNAKVVSITANPSGEIPKNSDLIIHLNAKTKFQQGEFPLGTVFEDSALIFLDMLIEKIRESTTTTEKEMLNRHNSFT